MPPPAPSPPSTERLFLAVPLPDRVRAELRRALPPDLPGRPVPPANWHLTLHFLGEVAPAARDRLLGELAQARMGAAFRLRFGGIGAFPRPGRARVLWLGVEEGGEELATLATEVAGVVRTAGLPVTERRFHPHLTLSRLRPSRPLSRRHRVHPPTGIWLPVRRVVLVRSILGAGPADHREIGHRSLGKA